MISRRPLVSVVATVILGALLLYGVFEARRLIEGPRITIATPADGSATSSAAVVISGFAENISFLSINGKPAYTDEQGHFSETLSPPPGYAIFTVAATDRFGRRMTREVHITVVDFCPIQTYG